MRTQDEIKARVVALAEGSEDCFGFQREVLLACLDFEHASEFLKDGVTAEEWSKELTVTRETLLEAAREYMVFAWGKAKDHRWLSAGRSVEKMSAYLWALGDDETLKRFEATGYANYGAPKLKVICEAYGWPIPDSEGLQRMMRGEHCGAEYGCGCGS